MPPWFVELMKRCEHLSLDMEVDRTMLWVLLREALPRDAIEAIIDDLVGALDLAVSHIDHEDKVARLFSAVMRTLEES